MNDFSTYSKKLEGTVTRVTHTIRILNGFTAKDIKNAMARVPDNATIYGVIEDDLSMEGTAICSQIIFLEETKHE